MPDQKDKRVYEAMFLVDPSVAATWDDCLKHLKGILARQGARIVGITRWDERKLAYPVEGQKRGTYVLAFFALGDAGSVAEIERDCRLSEKVLRVLIVRADQFTVSDMRLQLGDDVDEAVAARLAEEWNETAGQEGETGVAIGKPAPSADAPAGPS